MALVPASLAADIAQALSAAFANTEDSTAAQTRLANDLAVAIDKYIKSAQVMPGIPVATSGSPIAQTGATTGPGSLM